MTSSINADSYAQYGGFDELSYKCITYLLNNNEEIWKLLYHTTPTAWNEVNLTIDQKASMIYRGQDDSTTSKVFMDIGSPDVFTREDCIIRLSPYSIFPDNRVYGTISFLFEVYCHFKCNHLSNYRTRVDMITKNFIQTFNGINVPDVGIGRMFLDSMGSAATRVENAGQSPFKGRWVILSNKSP